MSEITLVRVKSLSGAGRTAPSGAVAFDERLSVPLWWWIPALVSLGLLYVDLHLGHPNWPAWAIIAVLAVGVGVAFHRLGSRRVTLTEADGGLVLQVGPATLSTRYISASAVVQSRAKQQALGPGSDPSAYLLHRPWIGPMVRITLDDPADPTPYWLFSCRHAAELVTALDSPHPRADPPGDA